MGFQGIMSGPGGQIIAQQLAQAPAGGNGNAGAQLMNAVPRIMQAEAQGRYFKAQESKIRTEEAIAKQRQQNLVDLSGMVENPVLSKIIQTGGLKGQNLLDAANQDKVVSSAKSTVQDLYYRGVLGDALQQRPIEEVLGMVEAASGDLKAFMDDRGTLERLNAEGVLNADSETFIEAMEMGRSMLTDPQTLEMVKASGHTEEFLPYFVQQQVLNHVQENGSPDAIRLMKRALVMGDGKDPLGSLNKLAERLFKDVQEIQKGNLTNDKLESEIDKNVLQGESYQAMTELRKARVATEGTKQSKNMAQAAKASRAPAGKVDKTVQNLTKKADDLHVKIAKEKGKGDSGNVVLQKEYERQLQGVNAELQDHGVEIPETPKSVGQQFLDTTSNFMKLLGDD